jgi:PAS domain S-box-containing protein
MKTTIVNQTGEFIDRSGRDLQPDYWTAALRLSELRYRRLFETAHDGILILDANSGEIIDVNPFMIDLLQYPFEELRGRKLWDIGEFKDIAANRAAFETLQHNEYIRYENLPLRRRDGKTMQVEFVSNVYWVEAEKVIQCNVRDISERVELKTHSDAHVAALEFATSTNKAWLVSHLQMLRTPLTAIASMLGLVELGHKLADVRSLQERPSEFDEAAYQHVLRNCQRLVHYFNEIAALSGQAPVEAATIPPPIQPGSVASPNGSANGT